MAIDTISLRSRRALLVGTVGGLAAAVAGSLGRAQPAAAGAGDVVLGAPNSASSLTSITNTATDGNALEGDASGYGIGVFGSSPSGAGVYGQSTGGAGSSAVYGSSGAGAAVRGHSISGYGVHGYNGSSSLPAVLGQSGGANTGLYGFSGLPISAPPSMVKTGVYGYANTDAGSVGVRGTAPAGRGGIFTGGTAPLKLVASSRVTHPASGQRGDLFVDKSGRLWFCKGGTSWKQLA